jgi:hypothetical protein
MEGAGGGRAGGGADINMATENSAEPLNGSFNPTAWMLTECEPAAAGIFYAVSNLSSDIAK